MGVATVVPLIAALAVAGRAPEGKRPFVEKLGEATVDWAAGTITAQGGAAADPRLPSVEVARPGAQRRARTAAVVKLRSALSALPLGGGATLAADEVERAVGRARDAAIEYQSNGGAVVQLEIDFGAWARPPDGGAGPAVVVVAVRSMALAAAPVVVSGKTAARTAAARYRSGAPPVEAHAVRATCDASGRVVVDGDVGRDLASTSVLIYVEQVLR